jgi:diguanylate cyclase
VFGDQVIRGVADAIRGQVKGQDVAARYGGDEFVVLLPRTPVDGGRALAEQIRATVQNSRIRRLNTPDLIGNITVSIGVAGLQPGQTLDALVQAADAALYQSKTAGRNRVTLAG